MNTNGYGGRTLKKIIKVYTSDKQHPVADLTVTGSVKKFANVVPARIVLNGEAGADLKMTAKISPVSGELFHITGTKADRGQNIRFNLAEGQKGDKKTYTLTVENTRTAPGRYYDVIRLSTDHKVHKEILIPVVGNITAPKIADITPRHIALNGRVGTPIKGMSVIVPRDGYSFSITEVKPHNGAYIKWDLKESLESGKKTYVLTVTNVKADKGRYYDALFLKTDSKDMPEIRISVSGSITE